MYNLLKPLSHYLSIILAINFQISSPQIKICIEAVQGNVIFDVLFDYLF